MLKKPSDQKDYSFLQSDHVFAAFVLSKLSDKDLRMIKEEQKALGKMLDKDDTSFYGQMLELQNDDEEEKKEDEVVQI